MEYRELVNIARREVSDQLENYLTLRFCPVCEAECSMLKVSVDNLRGIEDYSSRFRCLNCLGLFREGLSSLI